MTIRLAAPERRVLTADEAAQYLGYERATVAFLKYAEAIGVRPLPGRRRAYDKIHLDKALDRAGGLEAATGYEGVRYGSD